MPTTEQRTFGSPVQGGRPGGGNISMQIPESCTIIPVVQLPRPEPIKREACEG